MRRRKYQAHEESSSLAHAHIELVVAVVKVRQCAEQSRHPQEETRELIDRYRDLLGCGYLVVFDTFKALESVDGVALKP